MNADLVLAARPDADWEVISARHSKRNNMLEATVRIRETNEVQVWHINEFAPLSRYDFSSCQFTECGKVGLANMLRHPKTRL